MVRRATAGWSPWALSTGLHGVLLAMLAGGVVLTRLQPPTDTALALEAVVVDAATLAALQRSVAPRPQAAPRPEPTPARPIEAGPKPQARSTPAPQKSVASTKPAQPAKTVAPAKTVEPVKPVERSRPASPPVDPARAAAEADLQAALAEEERVAALRASGLAAQWSAAIRARIERAWIRPDSARPGLDCTVAVTQAPGGTVLRVAVRTCNGDEAVRQSIEDAVLRASPLPAPPDPALFERELLLRFRPDV
ncbi:MAG: TonB C-terminal domain-containing protein [Gammaproteobacteria bacterium]